MIIGWKLATTEYGAEAFFQSQLVTLFGVGFVMHDSLHVLHYCFYFTKCIFRKSANIIW